MCTLEFFARFEILLRVCAGIWQKYLEKAGLHSSKLALSMDTVSSCLACLNYVIKS